jgi:hypothetical protein
MPSSMRLTEISPIRSTATLSPYYHNLVLQAMLLNQPRLFSSLFYRLVRLPGMDDTYTNRSPFILTRKGLLLRGPSNPTGSSSLEQFSGIAIPTFRSPPRASGGSREGGRGIGEENLGAIQSWDI